MLTHHFKIGWRSLFKNKITAILNIGGLAIGMAVAIMIGLWIWDELSYNKSNKNYETVAQLARKEMTNGEVFIAENNNHFPIPLAAELRANYNNYFSHVALASDGGEQLITVGNNMFTRKGMYVEPDFAEIFTLNMLAGNSKELSDPKTILLSKSATTALFGNADPVGKVIRLSNQQDLKVGGVFADLPANNRFADIGFLCPFSLLTSTNDYVKQNMTNWNNSSFLIFVQTLPGNNIASMSKGIKDVYWPKILDTNPRTADDPVTLFLHPMKDWHLRSEWKNGVHAGGQIQILWLFGIIGGFVLLLACINFMNLSTARAEKRAKEVGVRKTLGSLRGQLVRQFLSESLLLVCISFVLSIGIVLLSLPAFNAIADKSIRFSFSNPAFWGISVLFILTTALVSGSYPAIYLSAFKPIKVLKGTFRAGMSATILRRVMAGFQFTVSITLIVATIVVYRQIQHVKDRPIGYDRNGLIRFVMNTNDLVGKYDVLQKELLATGAVTGFAQSSSTTTENNYFDDRIEWTGKDESRTKESFALSAVTYDFGKTVGWQFAAGRDFSRDFASDSNGVILNEAAVKYMSLKDPIGQTIKFMGGPRTIVGVIRDMITDSPFKPGRQSIYFMIPNVGPVITMRLNPRMSAHEAISRIQPIFTKLNPSGPFDYKFVDDEYSRKYASEERIGVLSGLFACLAILISCLGIFGLASFVAQQRIREISVRKVLGASVVRLWGLLTREFVILILISFVIAVPVANYFTGQWLQKYEYRTNLTWWIFGAAGLGAMIITLITVSFHTIKAAISNPVKVLRSE